MKIAIKKKNPTTAKKLIGKAIKRCLIDVRMIGIIFIVVSTPYKV